MCMWDFKLGKCFADGTDVGKETLSEVESKRVSMQADESNSTFTVNA